MVVQEGLRWVIVGVGVWECSKVPVLVHGWLLER